MKKKYAVVMVTPLLSIGAHAACTKDQVEWLESVGYSVDRAMGWCSRQNGPAPAVTKERPAPAPIKSAQLVEKLNALEDVGGQDQGRDEEARKEALRKADEDNRAEERRKAAELRRAQELVRAEELRMEELRKAQALVVTEELLTNKAPRVNERSTLADFSTKKGNGSNLVTAHIATAFAPMFQNTNVWRPFKAVSLDISAAIPAQSATLKDYGKQGMLTLDGGIVNIYTSLPGYDHQAIVQNTSPRNFDRNYFLPNEDKYVHQLLGYAKGGFGGRAIKTALAGNGYAGMATAYLGLGVDGPLVDKLGGSDKDPKAGWVSLEAFGVANAANKTTYAKLFGGTPTRSVLPSWGSNFNITLPGQFYLTVGYYRALGIYGKSNVGGTTVLAFGYNGGPEATPNRDNEQQRVRELLRQKENFKGIGPP